MYTFFYKRLKISKKVADNKVYILSNEELLELTKIERRAIFLSALIGAAMVLLLYLPQYYYATFFAESHFVIPYFDFAFDLSVWAFVYGLILVFIEIVLLTLLHIYCAHRTAVASGFIDENTKLNEDKLLVLLNVGKETKNKKILQLGINPYQGLSKRSVFVMNLFFTLKATLSNLLVRIFVKRILGRYALREVLDMMGIPVFAFWNAFATHKVLTEARLIIMGSNLINDLKNKLPQLALSNTEKEVLYDALQLVAMNKRDFHDNHYFLAKMVLEFYNIPFKKEHVCSADFIDKLAQQRPEVKRCCEFILLVGFILDGQISWREKKKINTMHDKKLLAESVSDIQQLAINFKKGKGIEDLEKRYL